MAILLSLWELPKSYDVAVFYQVSVITSTVKVRDDENINRH